MADIGPQAFAEPDNAGTQERSALAARRQFGKGHAEIPAEADKWCSGVSRVHLGARSMLRLPAR